MHIEEASTEHIPEIIKLAHAIWPVAYKNILSPAQLKYMLDLMYSKESLSNQMKQGHKFLLLFSKIYETDLPAGFASYSTKSKGSSIYRLHKLYVLPGQQGKGLGKFLLEHVIAAIKKTGASTLELNVNRDNPAQYFYHKMGFSITKEEDIDIGKGYFMNDYVMERRVVSSE